MKKSVERRVKSERKQKKQVNGDMQKRKMGGLKSNKDCCQHTREYSLFIFSNKTIYASSKRQQNDILLHTTRYMYMIARSLVFTPAKKPIITNHSQSPSNYSLLKPYRYRLEHHKKVQEMYLPVETVLTHQHLSRRRKHDDTATAVV